MNNLAIVDASNDLNIIRSMKGYEAPFEVIGGYRLIDDGRKPEATVMLIAGGQEMHEAAVGVGPVDALANVLHKSLGRVFPRLVAVKLMDYGEKVIQGNTGTCAAVEVTIIFSDGNNVWRVFSSSDNINFASFQALLDGYEYAINLQGKGGKK